ncbi:general substrate transporter [Plectosphaerella plurivora]|uniref:General substrate transporter n=1 Tax=Plectosphaerella plurivora TaxID=936078 RepID=A0A9P8V506_9PEZI|nr:general substrate transporter [Plectosphaerella plurivora]
MAPGAAKAVEGISSGIDYSKVPRFYQRKNGILLYFLLTSSALSSFASGFDGSQTNAMQLLMQWQNKFGHPTGSTLGFFGASTGIGGVIPLVLLNWLGDKYGRRLPTVVGSIFIIIGTLIQFFSPNLMTFVGGKIVLGFGVTTVQLGAPVLMAELSHPKERTVVTTFYNTSVYLGYVVGAWITFGVTNIQTEWQWKIPTLLQAAPSLYQLALIYFSPESPRWLVAQGREQEAYDSLLKWHGNGDPHSELVATEFSEIKEALAREREENLTWKDFFSSIPNWKRIGICIAIATFSQSSGNLLVSNYLPQILKDTGLKTDFENTLVNGMSTLWSYIVSLAVTALINRFRRRTFFLVGSGGVVIVFIAWTIASQQYIERGSVGGGRMVVACIFLFQTFYSIAWMNLLVMYPLEICPYHMRAKAWSLVLLVVYVAQIFGNYVNPVGLDAIGWKFYIYYCVWVSMIFVVVYFCFPETQGPTLEELARLFDGPKEKEAELEKTRDSTDIGKTPVEAVGVEKV